MSNKTDYPCDNDLEAFEPEVLVHLAWDGIPDFSERKCVQNYNSQVSFFRQTQSLSKLKKVIMALNICLVEEKNKFSKFEPSERILNYFK